MQVSLQFVRASASNKLARFEVYIESYKRKEEERRTSITAQRFALRPGKSILSFS
jgi:hypothetical protein